MAELKAALRPGRHPEGFQSRRILRAADMRSGGAHKAGKLRARPLRLRSGLYLLCYNDCSPEALSSRG